MPALDIERHVVELEGEVQGEKQLTRHLLEKLSDNTDLLLEMRHDMAAQNQRLEQAMSEMRRDMAAQNQRLEQAMSEVRRDVATLSQKLDKVADATALTATQLTALGPKLAGIVADAIRDDRKS